MANSKLVKRYKRRKARQSRSGSASSPRRNPPLFTDLMEFVGPGFGGFAATRFATRVTATQIAKRWPKLGKHAGAVASVGSFLAAWLVAHRIKWLAKYHTPIAVGAGIAAAQSLIQLYIPKLGWIVSDATPDLAAAAQQPQQQVTNGQQSSSPSSTGDFEALAEDGGWYVYNDAGDPGRYASAPKGSPGPSAQQQQAAQQQSEDDAVFDLLEDDAGDMQGVGSLGN